MAAATTDPDGYTVNTNDAWTENGTIQTKTGAAPIQDASGTQAGTYSTSEYDNNGISLAALDMFDRTREEYTKYGEISADANPLK